MFAKISRPGDVVLRIIGEAYARVGSRNYRFACTLPLRLETNESGVSQNIGTRSPDESGGDVGNPVGFAGFPHP